jgi:hypothetical protein
LPVLVLGLIGFFSPTIATQEKDPGDIEIDGYVYDETGAGLGGVSVIALPRNGRPETVDTNKDGQYKIKIKAGSMFDICYARIGYWGPNIRHLSDQRDKKQHINYVLKKDVNVNSVFEIHERLAEIEYVIMSSEFNSELIAKLFPNADSLSSFKKKANEDLKAFLSMTDERSLGITAKLIHNRAKILGESKLLAEKK